MLRFHPSPAICTPRRAFTLIELLVIIAIISLLASILFPVFGRAREDARRTSCLSNTRQLGIAFQQYLIDYDEQFPLLGKNGAPETSWFFTLEPYIKSRQMLRCPDDEAPFASDAEWANPALKARRVSYSLNGYLGPGNSNPTQGGNFPDIAAITKPSSLIFLAEAPQKTISGATWTENYFHAHLWNYPTSISHWKAALDRPDDIAYDRHFEGFNAAFLDGHAKWMKWETAFANRDPSVGGQTVTYVNSNGATVSGITPPMKGLFDPRQY